MLVMSPIYLLNLAPIEALLCEDHGGEGRFEYARP